MNPTARGEARDGMPSGSSEAASLVESATLLRWRAPELALLLADRAIAAGGEERGTLLRAERLAVFALNQLGRHGSAVHRLLPVLRSTPETSEHLLWSELQVELGQCAVALGEPATALAAVGPVLAAGEDIAPVLRGTALMVAAEAAGALGRDDIVSEALDEAEELFREDPQLDRDTTLLLRAAAAAVRATHHRRCAALTEAEQQARIGWALLPSLADPEHDSGQVSGRLMLEIALAMLDRGEGDAAVREARQLLRRPVRAAAATSIGWLRLALATRVHLAEGRHEPALALLADAVEVTQRHGVDGVLAECLEGLSHVHEVRGEFADALHCLRSARAAEARYRRVTETARYALFEHCGLGGREPTELLDEIAEYLTTTPGADEVEDVIADPVVPGPVPSVASAPPVPAPPPATPPSPATPSSPATPPSPAAQPAGEPATEEPAPPHAEEPRRRRTNGVPLLVSDLLPKSMLSRGRSGRRRAEDRAEDRAEQPAAAEAAAESDPTVDQPVEQRPVAEEPLEPHPVTEEPGPSRRVGSHRAWTESIEDTEVDVSATTPEETGAAPVSFPPPPQHPLNPPVSVPAAQNGVRPSGAAEGTTGEPSVSLPVPDAGLPPRQDGPAGPEQPPPPRARPAPEEGARPAASSDPGDPGDPGGSGDHADSRPARGVPTERELARAGMGDLLAEALVAFQESNHQRLGERIDATIPGVITATETSREPRGTSRGSDRYHNLRLTRGPLGRRSTSSVPEALTDPELRLPDLTAEPLWRPPGPSRNSAAGD